MTQITLSSEQAAILSNASEPVCVRLPNGTIAGWLKKDITPKEPIFTPEEIAEAERTANSPGPWYTTKEVLERLRSLDQT
jgi:hypothetical protein